MPINPDKSFTRLWRLVDEFAANSPIRRVDRDTEMDDIAAALNEVSLRALALEDGGVPGGNLILNPEFTVNTTTYAGATLPLLAYGHNRWRAQIESTVYSVTGNVCTVIAGAVGQLIDGRSVLGGQYVVSWAGDAACTINGGAVANGQTITLAAKVDVTVQFGGGSFSTPQIAFGAEAPPFRARPYEQELALCARFIFIERQEAIAQIAIHESINTVFAWSVEGAPAGMARQFVRRAVEPESGLRYQSLDGAWWEFIPLPEGVFVAVPPLTAEAGQYLRVNATEDGIEWSAVGFDWATGSTAARNSVATDLVLQAKAMSDHIASGDHDARYVSANDLADHKISDDHDARYAQKGPTSTFGVAALFRADGNINESVRASWDGSRLALAGYTGDTADKSVRVSFADAAGTAVNVSGIGDAQALRAEFLTLGTQQTNIGATPLLAHRTPGKSIAINEVVDGTLLDYAYFEDGTLRYSGPLNFGSWQATATAPAVAGGRVALQFRRYL